MVGLCGVRVFDVEVVAACFDVVCGHFPGVVGCFAAFALRAAPPVDAGLQVFQPDGFGHGIGFLAFGDAVFVEPDFSGRLAFLEEQQVGADGGVGFEDGVGQADDGVEVALFQQVFFEAGLDAFAEQGAVGQDDRGAPARFQQSDDEGQEQVCGFLGAEVLGEVAFDAVFFFAAEGGVGQHNIDSVFLFPADVGAGQGVVVTHEAGVLNAVQEHVGDAQHVRKLFFLNGAQAGLHFPFVPGPLDVMLAHVGQRTGQEPAGAAGRVEQGFAGLGVDAVGHERCDRARGVVFAGVARGLQIVQKLFVDVAEMLALGQVIEVNGVDFVHHLAHELAGFHVVVGVLEHVAHDAAAIVRPAGGPEVFQGGEEVVVNEGEQCFTGDAFGVCGPGMPLEPFRDGGGVVCLHQCQFLVLVVDDLEEEHPAQLADALGVAVHAGVLAHDVLDGLDQGADGHDSGGLLVEGGLQVADGFYELILAAEGFEQLYRRAEGVQRRDAQHVGVVEVEHAFVGVLVKQRVEHGAGLVSVLSEHVAFLDVRGALAAGQRLGVKGHLADEIEGVEILAEFLGDGIECQAFGRKFVNDGLFAFGGLPSLEKVIKAGEAFLQRLLGEVAQGLGDEFAVFVKVLHTLGNDCRVDAVNVNLALDRGVRLEPWGNFDNGFVVGRFWRERGFAVLRARRVVGRSDGIACSRFVYLHRLAVEVRVGKMAGRAPEVHQGEVEFVGVLVDAGAASDDLFEFGHGLDCAVQHDQPAGLGIDAGGEQPRGGDQHGVFGFRVNEVTELCLSFGIVAGDAHDVAVVVTRQVGVLVDERLSYAGGVFLVDAEDDCFLKAVAAFFQEFGDVAGNGPCAAVQHQGFVEILGVVDAVFYRFAFP